MNTIISRLLLIAALSSPIALYAGNANDTKAEPIRSVLGHGFGKIIEIEGRIVDARDTNLKTHDGRILIKVYWIGDKALQTPLVIEVMAFGFSAVKIEERGAWTRLQGYESGGFKGIPREAFGPAELNNPVATTDFYFESSFQVTATIKAKTPAPSDPGE